MAGIAGADQSPKTTVPLFNDVSDVAPGVPVSTTSVSGSIVQPYGGQLGGRTWLNANDAVRLADTAIGTLYDGCYQYVLFVAASTAANAVGQPVFWKDTEKYTVTPDGSGGTASSIKLVAGIALNAVGKGQYGFIQVAGRAGVKFGTITKATPAIGDAVFVSATPANPTLADVLSATTAVTVDNIQLYLGVAFTLPVSSAVSSVLLRGLPEIIG
jgi:hypothetical protein